MRNWATSRPLWVQLTAVSGCLVTSAVVATRLLGSPPPDLISTYAVLSLFAVGSVGAAALLILVARLFINGEISPARHVMTAVRRKTSPSYLAEHILPIVLVFAALGAFSSLKVLIPSIVPFGWDNTFARLDRFVVGADPWRVTHALIGPFGTRIIDFVYGAWMPIFAAVIVGVALFGSEQLRRRFFLSFMAIWIGLGLVLACVLSSAGPCFLTLLDQPAASYYRGLFPLQNAPGAAFAQAYLADTYARGGSSFASGISAMPSIHVSIAALYVFAFARTGSLGAAITLAFYLFILIGSVHLGWHYLIDGLVGTLGTWLIWRASYQFTLGRQVQSREASLTLPT